MTGLIEKAEALAATLGTDAEKLWDEFVAFVEGKKARRRHQTKLQTHRRYRRAEGRHTAHPPSHSGNVDEQSTGRYVDHRALSRPQQHDNNGAGVCPP